MMLPTFAEPIRHPARYSDALLPVMAQYLANGMLVLNPFGGVGGINRMAYTGAHFVTVEIEERVCVHSAGSRRVCADAQALPFASETFDAICTSPTYGNRMADTYVDESERNTYTAAFGFELHPHNSGRMQWGHAYRTLHQIIYAECYRTLKKGARLIVNISDHIRDGKQLPVAAWHYLALDELGFYPMHTHDVPTPRNRKGQNGAARVEVEHVFVFEK